MSENQNSSRCIIVGAGPAGLTAAFEAVRLGVPACVLEKDDVVGGISRTVEYRGFRFDIGGHRFFTKVPEVEAIWHELLGSELLVRPRLSRIFYNDTFFDYPIRPLSALRGLGLRESAHVGLSFVAAQIFPYREERTFEQWITNRFGRRLYEIFFKTYTEKVWGMPCSEIGADWAAQRIQNLDLAKAIWHSLLRGQTRGGEVVTTLVERFLYPRLGPGQLWERCRDLVDEKGCPTHLGVEVVRIRHDAGRFRSVQIRDATGAEREIEGAHCISSMPVRELVERLDPPPPAEVREAARRLRYRDFLTVALIVDRPDLFPDNWIYVHSSRVRVGRVQNFGNWSPDMVATPDASSLGLEYFVQEGDDLWSASDDELLALATRECETLGLLQGGRVVDGTVVRMPKAYPVYDAGYRDALATIRGWLEGLPNLTLVGRNGQHRYNNQDHSMVTALRAVRNLRGASLDVWDVNVEAEYHEEASEFPEAGDRAVPASVSREISEAMLRDVFAHYDPVALGGAVAVLASVGLFLATAILLLDGSPAPGPTLSLLGNYLLGYRVSWAGALFGPLEAGALGFGFGWIVARTINVVVDLHERGYRRQVELTRALDQDVEPV